MEPADCCSARRGAGGYRRPGDGALCAGVGGIQGGGCALFHTPGAATDFAAAEFVRIKANNLRKVALGVDLIGFNPGNRNFKLRRELLKDSQFLLVHCGRMSPEKEPQRSVQAIAELVNRGIDARW